MKALASLLGKKSVIFLTIMLLNCTANLNEKSLSATSMPGKAEWQPMLKYSLDLHKRSIHLPKFPFDSPWEEIGPGYYYGSAFGHWDIIHQIFDAASTILEKALDATAKQFEK